MESASEGARRLLRCRFSSLPVPRLAGHLCVYSGPAVNDNNWFHENRRELKLSLIECRKYMLKATHIKH
jgi:hypothetical protein